MKNVVVWGMDHPSINPAITKLSRRNVINVVAWFGDKTYCSACTHEIDNFFKGDFAKTQFEGISISIYNQVYKKLFNFVDMFTRRDYPNQFIYIHEYLNMFNIFVEYFCQLLIHNKVEVVILANIPHEGPDLVLYETAKALGVPRIVFYQSLFPNRFFVINDIEDFGEFSFVKTLSDNPMIKLDNKFEKDLFYMKENAAYDDIIGRIYHSVKKLMSKVYQVKGSNGNEIVLKITKNYLRHIDRIVFKKNMDRNAAISVDLNQKFVYFPLHLQPELTTSSLGGIYCDQLLALERLSQDIPDSWYIYVKENPKQTEFMRGNWFFDRLALIKKVVLLPSSYNTYTLIKKAMFVATVTGTVGWEAISGGKNALVFGQAWYKTLPGVYEYNEGLAVDILVQNKINHKELEYQLNELLKKTAIGVVDPAYIVSVEGFSEEANVKAIAGLIEKVI